MTFLLVLAYFSFAFGLWILLCSILNSSFLKRKKREAERLHIKGERKVSVIIPARNEEENLPLLLESLTRQDYPNFEVLVIDDQSTDSTWEIIESFQKRDHRFKGYKSEKGKKLSPYGKINALLQLIPHATGDILLCTDSDTIHSPSSISDGVRYMERDGLDILSGFPYQKTETYMGGCVTSAMTFATTFLPEPLIEALQFAPLAIGIGQYVMMDKKSYEDVGGYGAMPQKICDDLGIIKHFMRNGKRYGFRNLKKGISCTMYPSGEAAFKGIERSLTDIFPINIPMVSLLIVVVSVLFLFEWSILLTPLFISLSITSHMTLMLLGWLFFHLGWFMASYEIGFPSHIALSGIVSMNAIIAMYVHGLYRKISGKGFVWKGRKV